MADQCYFNGNFYQCATATSAGESPTTAAAKWRKVQLPKNWRHVLTMLTYAQLLKLDGQHEKALVQRDEALGAERVGLNDLIRLEANKEARRLERPSVNSY